MRTKVGEDGRMIQEEVVVEESVSGDERSRDILTDPSVASESAISLPGGKQKQRGVQTGQELLVSLAE